MWQSEHVAGQLKRLYPHCEVSILGITTRGDQIVDRPLAQIGGKGLFVKELEAALRRAGGSCRALREGRSDAHARALLLGGDHRERGPARLLSCRT